METSNLRIIDSLAIVENAENKLNEVPRKSGVIIKINLIIY